MTSSTTETTVVSKGGSKTKGSSDRLGNGVGRSFRGTVVSTKMKDTITVAVVRYVKHPKYKKYMTRTKKYLAHDAGNTKKEGEVVTIREVAPISKRKHFAVVN